MAQLRRLRRSPSSRSGSSGSTTTPPSAGCAAVDHSILIWNLLLLLCVGVLPFTTSLMATYLKEGSGEGLAAAIYGASFLVMGAVFGASTARSCSAARSC